MSKQNIAPFPEAIAETIAALEQASRLTLTLKIFSNASARMNLLTPLPRRYWNHETPFCLGIKEAKTEACVECDLRQIPTLCSTEKAPFIHFCHAGAGEVILPVYQHGILVALGYLGQFRRPRKGALNLPLRNRKEERYLLALGRMFVAYISEQIRTPLHQKETSLSLRRSIIETFLTTRLSDNPGLPDLATHLGLSVSRTAHATKAATGHSFTSLCDQLKLDRACHLLKETYHKVAYIARECGFQSPQYFHRFFRRKTGMTPLVYREQRPIEA